MRVHELAKELGVSSKALMDLLASMKIQLKSHSSTLDETTVERVRRRVKGQAEPKSAEPARVATTPSGERILGMRKIIPPPPPPEPIVADAAAGDITASETTQAKPAVPEPAVKVRPGAPEIRVVPRPAAPSIEREPGRPATRPAQPAAPPNVISREPRPGVRPAAAVPGTVAPARSPMRPAPPRREGPPRPLPPRAPVEPLAPAAGAPAPVPMVMPPKERPPKIKERLPPPPPPEPVAPPPVVPAEIDIAGPLTVGGLAAKVRLSGGDVVKRLLEQGVLAGVNQQITVEGAAKVAESFGSKVRKPESAGPAPAAAAPKRLEFAKHEAAVPRPPVVTIMGHVDHGKTSLLDAIRQTDVAAREFGGITQHIGASTMDAGGKRIVFIDTPGHEAFTTLRARGAQVTDIAVLVVAADDGIMPQTVEAINHAKSAGVRIIVAVNKTDVPDANPQRVLTQLMEHDLVPEDFGGQTVTVQLSAKTGEGVRDLLDYILLEAEVAELTADPMAPAVGTIIEAKLDPGK